MSKEMETESKKSDPVPVPHTHDLYSSLIPERLDGTNYTEWALNAKNKIRGRKHWGYISGKKVAPTKETSDEYETWQDENCMVKSWLLDAMTKDVRSLFIRLPTAKKIWESVKETYSVSQDASKAYQLYCKVISIKQDGGFIVSYFAKLQKLWQEIDAIENCTMECTKDVETYTNKLNAQRVYIFLAGLDTHLDGVRGRILATIPLPGIQTVYANVCVEANRQEAMLSATQNEGAVMAMKRPINSKKGNRKCTHCNGNNHVMETCFKLHGYPEWHPKGKKEEALNSNSTTATGFVAKSGKSQSACGFSVVTIGRDWIIDTGATHHMTCDKYMFTHLSSNSPVPVIINANGVSSPVMGIGTISISPLLTIYDVLFVPSLNCNLLSVSQLTKSHNCSFLFFPTYCILQNIHTKEKIGSGKRSEGLYYLEGNSQNSKGKALAHSMNDGLQAKNIEEIWQWHKRLGHPSFSYLKRLFPSLFSYCNISDFKCETCVMAKSHRVSFPLNNNRVDAPFSIIHSDVWGPAPFPTNKGMRWFVTFVDDCTRMTWLYFLKHKSDVCSVFQVFHKMITTQFNTPIKIVRSDNGGEYHNSILTNFMKSVGILHQTSCPNTPQQNGVAERKNRHLLEITRSLLIGSNVPSYLWGEALSSAVYLINRVPSSVLNFKKPIDVLSNHYTLNSVNNLPPHIFGCVIYVHLHPHQRTKLESRAMKCVFVGYSTNQKGYKAYNPSLKKYFVSMDVTFHEHELFFLSKTFHSSPQRGSDVEVQNHDIMLFDTMPIKNQDEIQDIGDENHDIGHESMTEEDNIISPSTSNPLLIQSSENSAEVYPETIHSITDTENVFADRENNVSVSSQSIVENNISISSQSIVEPVVTPYTLPPRTNRGQPPIRYEPDPNCKVKYPINNYVSFKKLSKSYANYASQLSIASTPSNMQEALADSRWTQAMAAEMEALEKNATWELVSLPVGKSTVGCRWVYTIKHKADGSVERFKARLVAKGYTQSYGVDYQETFAPVAKLNTVRVLLSLAANQDWPLLQFDVKNAFLHGDLVEEVYMDPPPGIPKYSNTSMVCKLNKALYGLKQSPRAWFGRFTKSMKFFGYTQSNYDHTLFLKHNHGKITALIIYVDDMIVTGNDPNEISSLQRYLASNFDMKQLGDLKYFLGIEVARSKHGIFLSQRKYVLDLLTETGMLGCKPIDTPIEQNHKNFHCADALSTDRGRYQRLVGKLIYLSHTRPDIAYAVNVVSQFMHDPKKPHMDAVERILRYLKSAPGKGLLFSNHGQLKVEGYTDADWAGSADDRKSTAGYFTFVGGNLVTWRSKKQQVVARSSAEAEFRGMAVGICELLWIKSLLKDLGYEQEDAMKLYCDNKSAIEIAHNPVQHDRTKHVEIDRHFIKEKIEAGIITFPFVKSEQQLADMLTKAVTSRALSGSLDKLGMCDIHAPT
jgi:transposase InsO family protein